MVDSARPVDRALGGRGFVSGGGGGKRGRTRRHCRVLSSAEREERLDVGHRRQGRGDHRGQQRHRRGHRVSAGRAQRQAGARRAPGRPAGCARRADHRGRRPGRIRGHGRDAARRPGRQGRPGARALRPARCPGQQCRRRADLAAGRASRRGLGDNDGRQSERRPLRDRRRPGGVPPAGVRAFRQCPVDRRLDDRAATGGLRPHQERRARHLRACARKPATSCA